MWWKCSALISTSQPVRRQPPHGRAFGWLLYITGWELSGGGGGDGMVMGPRSRGGPGWSALKGLGRLAGELPASKGGFYFHHLTSPTARVQRRRASCRLRSSAWAPVPGFSKEKVGEEGAPV